VGSSVVTLAEAEVRTLRVLREKGTLSPCFGVRRTPMALAFRRARVSLLVRGEAVRTGSGQYRITEKGLARLATEDARGPGSGENQPTGIP
jgi:hypothetical protein